MKVIIAGSRKLEPTYREITRAIENSKFDVQTIVSGMARGVDTSAALYAGINAKSHDLVKFPANWERYGKRAGFVRNTAMADYSDALIVIRTEPSTGTNMMIKIAKEKGLPVYIHELDK